MSKKNIYDALEDMVMQTNINEEEKKEFFNNLLRLKEQKVNILITGATGCGKSSTINALFNTEVAKVGESVDPETMEIEKYELENLVLWDTPGLGDGKEADTRHAKAIIKKLLETDKDGKALIDLVLVILDGGSRNMGTDYELINKVIIPNLGKNKENRILVAINQADMAMKGKNWDYEKNEPNQTLKQFLEEKVLSVKRRIYEGTGVNIEPIYYCAGYSENGIQSKPYNLSKLLYYIVKSTPSEKRLVYTDNINSNPEMWRDDDKLIDYSEETRKSFMESVRDVACAGKELGGLIGGCFGRVGKKIGEGIGIVAGTVVGIFSSLFR